MRTLDPPMESLLTSRLHFHVTTWELVRTDGFRVLLTDHDKDLEIGDDTFGPNGGFNASARQHETALRPSNAEVNGVLTSDLITVEDLQKRLYNGAEINESIVDSRYPWAGAFAKSTYWISEVKWTDNQWTAQLVGAARWLRQRVGDAYAENCRHELGDAFGMAGVTGCKYDLVANAYFNVEITAVDSVLPRLIFEGDSAHIAAGADSIFKYGKVAIKTGENAGITRQVKEYVHADREFTLEIPMRRNLAIGDLFDCYHGCDKLTATCKGFGQFLNYGGFIFIPGTDAAMETPTTG